ncbi:hypothetical protein EDB86DRAFT_3075213 [Lactarius hatsudake]|nr:hypothetical protein EDB86DRAFT_3075213 [Lactarius hatsudake]
MLKLGTDGASAGVPEVVANNSIALIFENARLDVAQQGEDRVCWQWRARTAWGGGGRRVDGSGRSGSPADNGLVRQGVVQDLQQDYHDVHTRSDALRPGPFPFIISIHITEDYHYPKAPSPGVSGSVSSLHPEYYNDDTVLKPKLHVSVRESSQNLRRSFYLTQLQRGSLHLEKRLIKQKIKEHEISLQALKERMADVEKNIASTTNAVISMHCYMDQVGVPIPDMPEHVAASIMFSDSEDDDAIDPQDEDAATSEDNEVAPGSWHRVQEVDADMVVGTMGKGHPCYASQVFLNEVYTGQLAQHITDNQLNMFHPHDPCTIVLNEVLVELRNPHLHAEVSRLRECLVRHDAIRVRQSDIRQLETELTRDQFHLDMDFSSVRKRLQYARAIPLIADKYAELHAKPVCPRGSPEPVPLSLWDAGPSEMPRLHGEGGGRKRKCFQCKSTEHLVAQCPERRARESSP